MAGWGGGGPYNNLYREALPKRIPVSIFRIDYCTLFSTFDMDKLKNPMERTPLN